MIAPRQKPCAHAPLRELVGNAIELEFGCWMHCSVSIFTPYTLSILLGSVILSGQGFAAPVAVSLPDTLICTSCPWRSAKEAATTAASNADSFV
jgi:hypothetical protein